MVVNFEFNYNFSRVIDEIEYLRLPDISEHTVNINLSKNFKNNFSFLDILLQKLLWIYKTITAPTSGQQTYIPSFYQTNLSIVKNGFGKIGITKDIKLKLAINNLFDYTNV